MYIVMQMELMFWIIFNCFSEKTTGNVLATFLVTDENENVLSNAMFEEFDDLLHTKLCLSPTVEVNASRDTLLYRDEDNNAIMTYRIVQQERNKKSIYALKLEESEMEKESVLIGTFELPRKIQELKSVELDVSQSDLVKKVNISGMAMQMTFDDAYAYEQFEQQLKDSGEWYKPDFDLEEHGYDFYNKELVLVMKDGTRHVIWNWDESDDGFAANSLESLFEVIKHIAIQHGNDYCWHLFEAHTMTIRPKLNESIIWDVDKELKQTIIRNWDTSICANPS